MTLSNPLVPPIGLQPRRLGAVIAGGRAVRFGGDKALADWHGRPLIEHAIAALRPHVEMIVVAGRTHPGYVTVADVPEPALGPLGGIAGALRHALSTGVDSVLTIGCDMPEVPPELIALLLAGGARYCSAVPILAHWPAALAPALESHLASGGDRSVRRFAASVGAIGVEWAGSLPNVNTPADLPA